MVELLEARDVTLAGREGWTFEYRLRCRSRSEVVVRVVCASGAREAARERGDQSLLRAIETRGADLAIEEARRLRSSVTFHVIEILISTAPGPPRVHHFPGSDATADVPGRADAALADKADGLSTPESGPPGANL